MPEVLKFPLTNKALLSAFASLEPDGVILTKSRGWHEACVDGTWPLSRLRKCFKDLGFQRVGKPEDLYFVDKTETVGLQCIGIEAHPTKNTWKTYSIQAKPN